MTDELKIVSATLTPDALATSDLGLPAKYSVALGLSRRMTMYEENEIVGSVDRVASTGDPRWLVCPETTADYVREILPELQQGLDAAVLRARAIQQAAESLDASARDEHKRRMGVITEINKSLAPLREARN
jgi:hypothetical protein